MLTFDIGVDVDDVLFPWSAQAHAACQAAGITNGNEVTQWEPHLDYGCTVEEFWDVLHAAYAEGMLLNARPIPHAARALRDLAALGHRVHLVTARGHEGPLASMVRDTTRQWIEKYDLRHDSLTFVKDKRKVRCDYFADDSITNVAALRGAGVEAYLVTMPHNQSDTTLPRVADLRAFARLVRSETELMDQVKEEVWTA